MRESRIFLNKQEYVSVKTWKCMGMVENNTGEEMKWKLKVGRAEQREEKQKSEGDITSR